MRLITRIFAECTGTIAVVLFGNVFSDQDRVFADGTDALYQLL
ncbi:MAG TPA: hypothetical protein VGJ66_20420 [Pyrinomonadaceae bacterium]